MAKEPKTYYKYRAFNTSTLDSLVHDSVYFANPSSFNDPLDCVPSVDGNSTNEELRELLSFLIKRRSESDIINNLKKARIKGEHASVHAEQTARLQTNQMLQSIAYHATNPDYGDDYIESESWLLVQEIQRELERHYVRGVCSFSTTFSSPLLWSHYGDQHQGLCIGYGLNRDPTPILNKVIYGGNRSIKTSLLIKAFINNDKKAQTTLDRDVLLRKANGWSYEREWRLIGEQGVQDSPLLLKDVTFGIRCPISVMHSTIQALSGREEELSFYEMRTVQGSFALRRRLIDIDELSAYLPSTAMSGVEMFGRNEDEH
ncbi:MAG: DUF2971 domain-containing protein [Candidatus Thiodiazotropha lotti]